MIFQTIKAVKAVPNKTKQIIFLIITLLLIGLTNLTYSQNGRQKNILYEQHNYSANGYVSKNSFVENQVLTFRTERIIDYQRILKDTILSGRYFNSEDGNSYIDGIWKEYVKTNNFDKIVKVKGVFKIANNQNGIGITTNKRKGEKLIIETIPNSIYNLEIKYAKLKLETSINYSSEQKISSDLFDNSIKNSKQVKLTFANSDFFTGTVKEQWDYSYYPTEFIPKNGEYKYASGEVCNGEMFYSNVYYRFLLSKGTITFTDGSIGKDDWLDQYNLTSNEEDNLHQNYKTLTEMRNSAKSISDKKERKLLAEKLDLERKNQEIIKNNKIIQNDLIKKYGNYWGNVIYKKEYTPGMTKEMVLEFSNEKYYKISKLIRNGNSIEIWEFDKQKMILEIVKSGDKKETNNLLLYSNYENMGLVDNLESGFPTLVFSNGELTDVYQN